MTKSNWLEGKQSDRPTYVCDICLEPTETTCYQKKTGNGLLKIYKCHGCGSYIDQDGEYLGNNPDDAEAEMQRLRA